MTRDEAVDIIMGRLGKRTNASLQADIIMEMFLTVQPILLEKNGVFFPWFLEASSLAALTTTIDSEVVALPSDFLAELEDDALWYYDAAASSDQQWTVMIKDDWDIIKARRQGGGKPTHYAVKGTDIYLKPTPDQAYTLRLGYNASDVDLNGTYGDGNGALTNQWLTHAADWFIAETGALIAEHYIQSDPLANRFRGSVSVAKQRVYMETISKKEINQSRQMGED